MAALNAYSRLDQSIHKIAYWGRGRIQRAMADVEESMFRKDLGGIDASRPIFVTSLPRAGTTILLTALSELPGLATHLYRDMPFLMAPMLWAKLSKGFQTSGEMTERAHGDGIAVGYDSPEAFEEVIWKSFWPDHYEADRIRMWTAADRNPEAEEFLRGHLAKIIALRCPDTKGTARYISKNNGNVARLPLLRAIWPEAAIVVPVRDPLTHAASLWRQHRNFADQHAADPFVKRYMEDIGHFEFGALHRPIAFPGLEALTTGSTPEDLRYWLGYWIAAFEHLETLDLGIVYASHEGLSAGGRPALAALCARIGLPTETGIDAAAAHFRPVAERAIDHDLPADLLERARDLARRLAAPKG